MLELSLEMRLNMELEKILEDNREDIELQDHVDFIECSFSACASGCEEVARNGLNILVEDERFREIIEDSIEFDGYAISGEAEEWAQDCLDNNAVVYFREETVETYDASDLKKDILYLIERVLNNEF